MEDTRQTLPGFDAAGLALYGGRLLADARVLLEGGLASSMDLNLDRRNTRYLRDTRSGGSSRSHLRSTSLVRQSAVPPPGNSIDRMGEPPYRVAVRAQPRHQTNPLRIRQQFPRPILHRILPPGHQTASMGSHSTLLYTFVL